jgi:hypothetical protein
MTGLYYPAAVWLDSIPLTDQGRSPVAVTREEKYSENELSSARKVRYFQAVKHKWSWSWTYLPDEDNQTLDGAAARETIIELLGNRGSDHVLKFYNKADDYEEYPVFCDSYNETLIRRDPSSGIFFWEVGIEFCEI